MKLSTVALWSTLGMSLTSVSVWALTPTSMPGRATTDDPAAAVGDPGLDDPTLTKLWEAPRKVGASFSGGETLHVTGRLGQATLLAGEGAETFVHLDISGRSGDVAQTAAPLNLSIVLDRSRSMEGQRMRNALAAARGMIRRLRPGDTVSVVAYNTQTDVLVPATTIDEASRGQVLFSLRELEARGHTCISCGIEAGLAAMGQRPGTVARMLLLSDGEANAGVRDPEGFRTIAERAYDSDVSISSIGVDVDYNERIMFTVAQASNGRHYFVEDPLGLPAIFDEEIADLVKTVANDANVAVDLAPGVALLEVYDRAFRRDGNRILVPFGSVAADEHKTLLLRVRLPRAEAGEQPVASVQLTYDDLTTDGPGSCTGELAAQMTRDPSEVSELDAVVENRLARVETKNALAAANEQFARGELDAARTTLQDNRGRIRRRQASAKKKAPGLERLDEDFETQLRSLDQADRGFADAAAEAPSDPSLSRKGKAQIRSNVDDSFLLGL
jgi:Ca-activated chloride channel family protein